MDSITQAVLGAAVVYPFLGKQLKRKALLLGVILGTLPDLDVFVPLGDPVSDFVYHRSATHSLLVHLLVTPFLAKLIIWLCKKRNWANDLDSKTVCLATFLALTTHALLDAFTVYGTQLLWPLDKLFNWSPVSWSTVFIIDPLFTLPLIVVCAYAFFKKSNPALNTVSYGFAFECSVSLLVGGSQSFC